MAEITGNSGMTSRLLTLSLLALSLAGSRAYAQNADQTAAGQARFQAPDIAGRKLGDPMAMPEKAPAHSGIMEGGRNVNPERLLLYSCMPLGGKIIAGTEKREFMEIPPTSVVQTRLIERYGTPAQTWTDEYHQQVYMFWPVTPDYRLTQDEMRGAMQVDMEFFYGPSQFEQFAGGGMLASFRQDRAANGVMITRWVRLLMQSRDAQTIAKQCEADKHAFDLDEAGRKMKF